MWISHLVTLKRCLLVISSEENVRVFTHIAVDISAQPSCSCEKNPLLECVTLDEHKMLSADWELTFTCGCAVTIAFGLDGRWITRLVTNSQRHVGLKASCKGSVSHILECVTPPAHLMRFPVQSPRGLAVWPPGEQPCNTHTSQGRVCKWTWTQRFYQLWQLVEFLSFDGMKLCLSGCLFNGRQLFFKGSFQTSLELPSRRWEGLFLSDKGQRWMCRWRSVTVRCCICHRIVTDAALDTSSSQRLWLSGCSESVQCNRICSK